FYITFFFSSRRRHTRSKRDWSSDVCSSDLIIWLNKDDIMMLSLKNVDAAVQFFGRTTVVMGISATLALLFLSILDYIYQRYDYRSEERRVGKESRVRYEKYDCVKEDSE